VRDRLRDRSEEEKMTQPFIFVGTHKIKEGKLEEYRKSLHELVELVETNEPRLIAFNVYVDEAANRVTGVQVHPDAASMEFHMNVVAEHIQGAYDYIDKTESIDVFGEPTDALLEGMRRAAPPGTPLRIVPTHDAGITRTNAAR
jgi:quinol monooxygenase YgiN